MEAQDAMGGLVPLLLQSLLGLHAEIAALEPDDQRKTEQRARFTFFFFFFLPMLLEFIKMNFCDIFRRPRNHALITEANNACSSAFQG